MFSTNCFRSLAVRHRRSSGIVNRFAAPRTTRSARLVSKAATIHTLPTSAPVEAAAPAQPRALAA